MIQLIITVDEAGRLNVNGPIDNKMLCYGLLESARDAIQAYQPPANGLLLAKPALVPPNGRS